MVILALTIILGRNCIKKADLRFDIFDGWCAFIVQKAVVGVNDFFRFARLFKCGLHLDAYKFAYYKSTQNTFR